MNNKDLTNLRLFCHVVASGGFTSAQKNQQKIHAQVSVATLSRAVVALEKSMGEKLLHRHAKQFQLTHTGEKLYQQFAPLFIDIDEKWQQHTRKTTELIGDIHIACTVPFTELFLQKIAIGFMRQHPKVNIIVHYARDTSGFIDEKIDISIVNFATKQNHLIQKRLFSVPVSLASSTSYIAQYGCPQTVEELCEHQLLSGNSSATHWELEHNGQKFSIPVHAKYQVNNFSLINEAVIAGLGICLMPKPYLDGLHKAGQVIPILEDVICPMNDTYVVWSDRVLIADRITLFIDMLFANLDKTETFLNDRKEH